MYDSFFDTDCQPAIVTVSEPSERYGRVRQNIDGIWKVIIEALREETISYFYSDQVDSFDLSRSEFLNPGAIVKAGKGAKEYHNRDVDALIKIPYINSDDHEMLHIEFEDDRRLDTFAKRMWEYYYQLCIRFGRPTDSVAIYIGKKKIPGVYQEQCRHSNVTFNFSGYSISDLCIPELIAKKVDAFVLVLWIWQTRLKTTKKNIRWAIQELKTIFGHLSALDISSAKKHAVIDFMLCCVMNSMPLDPKEFSELQDFITNSSKNKIEMESIGKKFEKALMNTWKAEVYEDGIQTGRKEARKEALEDQKQSWKALLSTGRITAKELATIMHKPLAIFLEIQKQIDSQTSTK